MWSKGPWLSCAGQTIEDAVRGTKQANAITARETFACLMGKLIFTNFVKRCHLKIFALRKAPQALGFVGPEQPCSNPQNQPFSRVVTLTGHCPGATRPNGNQFASPATQGNASNTPNVNATQNAIPPERQPLSCGGGLVGCVGAWAPLDLLYQGVCSRFPRSALLPSCCD